MGEKRLYYPPFTPNFRFTGPFVAISCDVAWDEDQECYLAQSSAGFRGFGDTAERAALACFMAWMGGIGGWFDPASKDLYEDADNLKLG